MGYYQGQRENPCPRCGGIVYTLFISVGDMSFSQECNKCNTTEFTPTEDKALGANGMLNEPKDRYDYDY